MLEKFLDLPACGWIAAGLLDHLTVLPTHAVTW